MKTIFVSIASYRDKLCSTTLLNMFEMAKHPEHIFCGICQQNNDAVDLSCIFPQDHPLYHLAIPNIQKISISHNLAKGPTYARYLCSTLYKNQDFFMQIDSHTLFIKDWDQVLLDMFLSLEAEGHENVIISHYPPDYKDHSKNNTMVTFIQDARINQYGIPVFNGAIFKKPKQKPELNFFISCNFFIARKTILKDVPFDPHLPFLFEGEEILYTIRAYTHGYNIFSPNKNILFHYYIRSNEPKFWDDLYLANRDSILKVKYYLSYPINIHKIKSAQVKNSINYYGLGNKRSLRDYFKKAKIFIKKKNDPWILVVFILLLLVITIHIIFQ